MSVSTSLRNGWGSVATKRKQAGETKTVDIFTGKSLDEASFLAREQAVEDSKQTTKAKLQPYNPKTDTVKLLRLAGQMPAEGVHSFHLASENSMHTFCVMGPANKAGHPSKVFSVVLTDKEIERLKQCLI